MSALQLNQNKAVMRPANLPRTGMAPGRTHLFCVIHFAIHSYTTLLKPKCVYFSKTKTYF